MLDIITYIIIAIDFGYFIYNKHLPNQKKILTINAYTKNSTHPEDRIDGIELLGVLDFFIIFGFNLDIFGKIIGIIVLLIVSYIYYKNNQLALKIKPEGISGTFEGKYKTYPWEYVWRVTVHVVEEEMVIFFKSGETIKFHLDYVPDEDIKKIGRVVDKYLNKEVVIY